jgi:2-polyprenyl-3-methyl-5-hydroxy-6-metoxy-1,4-benzoquinol methylase
MESSGADGMLRPSPPPAERVNVPSSGPSLLRVPSAAEYSHDALGDRFERALSTYDTRRRVETLIDEFLPAAAIAGKSVLDVGCGLGYFSERLVHRGAIVTACDIGPGLLERTRQRAGCDVVLADALDLVRQFGRDRFDVVISSECIEHTPAPDIALAQMVSVLRPGGYISVSTPNIVWSPIVRLASATGMRPFDGLENFSSWRSIRSALTHAGARIVRERGLHLVPFQFGLDSLSGWCDRHLQPFRGLMINICVLAQKEV